MKKNTGPYLNEQRQFNLNALRRIRANDTNLEKQIHLFFWKSNYYYSKSSRRLHQWNSQIIREWNDAVLGGHLLKNKRIPIWRANVTSRSCALLWYQLTWTFLFYSAKSDKYSDHFPTRKTFFRPLTAEIPSSHHQGYSVHDSCSQAHWPWCEFIAVNLSFVLFSNWSGLMMSWAADEIWPI